MTSCKRRRRGGREERSLSTGVTGDSALQATIGHWERKRTWTWEPPRNSPRLSLAASCPPPWPANSIHFPLPSRPALHPKRPLSLETSPRTAHSHTRTLLPTIHSFYRPPSQPASCTFAFSQPPPVVRSQAILSFLLPLSFRTLFSEEGQSRSGIHQPQPPRFR